MKHSNCGSEWDAKVKHLQIKNCPFCSTLLVNDTKKSKGIGAGELIRLIIEQLIKQFRTNVLLEK